MNARSANSITLDEVEAELFKQLELFWMGDDSFDRRYLPLIAVYESESAYQQSYYAAEAVSDELRSNQVRCGEVQANITYSDHRCVIAIAGTNSLRDWFTNLNIRRWRPFPENPIFVHEGFFDHASLLSSEIEKLGLPRQAKFMLTGHSLGGAAAMVLPIVGDFWGKAFDIDSLITFGCPRVGNNRFQRYLGDICRRGELIQYVNTGDVIPHLPFRLLFGGYRHPPNKMRLLTREGVVHQSRTAAWKEYLYAAVKAYHRSSCLKLPVTILRSHSMREYIDRILPSFLKEVTGHE